MRGGLCWEDGWGAGALPHSPRPDGLCPWVVTWRYPSQYMVYRPVPAPPPQQGSCTLPALPDLFPAPMAQLVPALSKWGGTTVGLTLLAIGCLGIYESFFEGEHHHHHGEQEEMQGALLRVLRPRKHRARGRSCAALLHAALLPLLSSFVGRCLRCVALCSGQLAKRALETRVWAWKRASKHGGRCMSHSKERSSKIRKESRSGQSMGMCWQHHDGHPSLGLIRANS